jgi:AraC-like DNA-binding protein
VYELRAPARDLSAYIENYWFVGADEQRPLDLRVDVFVDGRADLIFNFGAPYLRQVIGGKARKIQRSNLDAQRLVPIRISQRGDVRTTGVRFRLGGLGPFCRVPLQPLTGLTATPARVFGGAVRALEAALGNTQDLDAQARQLDAFFRAQVTLSGSLEAFQRALAAAVASAGAASLAELSEAARVSPRQVERVFSQFLGIAPRTLGRVLRFQTALRALMRDPGCTLAEVASAAGYFDQAHFVKDFKRLSGGVPRGYRGYFPPSSASDFAPNVVVFLQDEARQSWYTPKRTSRSARAPKKGNSSWQTTGRAKGRKKIPGS